jgi:hypothetical protein
MLPVRIEWFGGFRRDSELRIIIGPTSGINGRIERDLDHLPADGKTDRGWPTSAHVPRHFGRPSIASRFEFLVPLAALRAEAVANLANDIH